MKTELDEVLDDAGKWAQMIAEAHDNPVLGNEFLGWVKQLVSQVELHATKEAKRTERILLFNGAVRLHAANRDGTSEAAVVQAQTLLRLVDKELR